MLTTRQFHTTPNGRTIAYHQRIGLEPGVIFLGGFKSNMYGTKAMALESWCIEHQRSFIRFDYSGHGESSGEFEQGSIGDWLQDTLSVVDSLTEHPQVLVGSSMGGWLMLLATLQRPERIAGLVGIATAADFTESLIWSNLTKAQQRSLQQQGQIQRPSDYQQAPYTISHRLITEGRMHLILDRPIELECPVRLLHGLKDQDVPWTISEVICRQITNSDVHLHLVKDAEHRFSRKQDILLILSTLESLLSYIATN